MQNVKNFKADRFGGLSVGSGATLSRRGRELFGTHFPYGEDCDYASAGPSCEDESEILGL